MRPAQIGVYHLRLVGTGIALKGAYRIRTTGRLGCPGEADPQLWNRSMGCGSFFETLRKEGYDHANHHKKLT
jgi:hypothetical protein